MSFGYHAAFKRLFVFEGQDIHLIKKESAGDGRLFLLQTTKCRKIIDSSRKIWYLLIKEVDE